MTTTDKNHRKFNPADHPELKPWKIEDHLQTEEDIEAGLNVGLEAVVEEGDPSYLVAVLAALCRKDNISHLAKVSGVSRQTIHAVINQQADVRLSTLSSLLTALGYGLNVHRTTREVA
ncbi:hypothetical protein GCM10007874_49810 [Labrys miyagiensis]|uniref:Addiction module antidote protein n=1 Tax=Labrys miyagiensis TaxID=346912 RepID=A0ABQ6CQF0_9HYPH|nr:helix-turn-helix domain-containing protein [Labrys miyagiensis]GLS21964.1 hypothetical protein GCM10007874_49810 [Labrys miyagiensis]